MEGRAQSHVVGVALMLGLAVIALGALTLGIGTVLESQAGTADASRVGTAMADGLDSVEQTGPHSQPIAFSQGTLGTERRTLRVIENGTVIERYSVDALVFEGSGQRVAALAGAVVRGRPDNAWLTDEPPVTSSERTGVLVVGVPVLNASGTGISGQGGVRATLETNVSHARTDLGTGKYAVALETRTPEPFERYFRAQNATVMRRTFAGDRHESVVARYPGMREGYVVVHDLGLEVNGG
jgi:hypothetical protein